MKNMNWKGMMGSIFLILIAMAFFPLQTSATTAAPAQSKAVAKVDPHQFPELEGRGEWIEVNRFGLVWRPFVAASWRPFLYGDWVWSDAGWEWTSYEPYGWLVYHYGNWYYQPDVGWFWIPGYDWSPAPVDWVDFDDYIGWAPLPPPGFYFADAWDMGPVLFWNVVEIKHFGKPDMHRFALKKPAPHPNQKITITKTPPDVRKVEVATKQKLQPLHLTRSDVKMGDHTFQKIAVPDSLAAVVAQNQKQIEKDVLKPRRSVSPKMATHMNSKKKPK